MKENEYEYEMSLDVALDIVGTLRMMKINEITEEKNKKRKEKLEKELKMLTEEEAIAYGLRKYTVSEEVYDSIMDKIKCYYAPKLRAYYESIGC